MSPDDPRHGTNGGYYAGCREECCRAAATRYVKRLRMDNVNGLTRTIPAIGTWRRIEALMCLGWSQAAIAERTGIWQPNLSKMLRTRNDRIRRSIADRIAEAYDDLSMSVPEGGRSAFVRGIARKRGYAPPLAWDDATIDDPDAEPNTGHVKKLTPGRVVTRTGLIEDAEWLAADDMNLTNVLERLGASRENFYAACKRSGRLDLFAKLARRDPTGEISAAVRATKRGAA